MYVEQEIVLPMYVLGSKSRGAREETKIFKVYTSPIDQKKIHGQDPQIKKQLTASQRQMAGRPLSGNISCNQPTHNSFHGITIIQPESSKANGHRITKTISIMIT